MKKNKVIVVLLSLLTFGSLASGLLASVAWFATTNAFNVNVTGSVVEDYFHCGTGTAQDPYVITRPIHYYHLVEFYQRLTALTEAPHNAHFGTDYLYFQVGYDFDDDGVVEVYDYDDQGIDKGTYSSTLNMAYYSGTNALLPIGTNEVPFIGSFDGKADDGIVISNLNIHCAERVEVGNQFVDRATSDIGVFGYVADADGNSTPTIIKETKIDGLTIDLSDVPESVAQNASHVTGHSGQAYVGYIAGHIHTYTNYIPAEAPSIPTNATPLYNVYVNNATVKGGPGTACNYGYIGFVDSIDNGETTATVAGEVSELITGGGGSSQGDDWGGSIPFNSLNQRLYNSLKTSSTMGITSKNTSGNTITSGGPMYRYYSKTDSKVTVYRGGSSAYTYFNTNPNNGSVIFNLMGTNAQYGNNNPGTVIPLQVNNDYSVATSNTGYIMSDSVNNTNGSIRCASYKIQNIIGSLGDYSESTYTTASLYNNNYSVSYNKAKFEVLTNSGANSSSGYSLISDDYNSGHTPSNGTFMYDYRNKKTSYTALGLEKYKDARDTLDEILTGASFVHGLHFYGSTSDTSTRVVSTNPYTITARINGSNAIANYPLPHSCIDFNLKEQGRITLFTGVYYPATSGTNADSILSLFHITRGANNSISSIQQIQKIYSNSSYNSSDPTSNKYVYSYNGNKPSGAGDIVFDVTGYLNGIPKRNIVCYFEIPVNAGEYAIGGVTGKEAGAYLMYLDIAASAGETQEPTFNDENLIKDAPLFTQIDFQINSYVINSCFNIGYIVPAGSTKETFSITVSCGTSMHEGHSYTCYVVTIINESGSDFTLNALLMDDDSDPENDYYYMYSVIYNDGEAADYFTSNTLLGHSGDSTMTAAYVPQAPDEEETT